MPVHAYLVTDRRRYRQERPGAGRVVEGVRGLWPRPGCCSPRPTARSDACGSGGGTMRARVRVGAEDGPEVPVEGFQEVMHTDDVVAGDRTGRSGPVERYLGCIPLRLRPRLGRGAVRA